MIPVNTPLLDGNEKKYLIECIESGWISSEGPFVGRFEEAFAKAVDRKHGIACANGSGALDIAVAAAGIGPGDEVIMPTFTIISPAASIVRAGATPVLIDSEPTTWNMDVSQIPDKITSRTKAILVVHVYGIPTDMNTVLAIAKDHNLVVIEDAAEMHGQSYRGEPCGSFGDLSTFSFYPNKHITTGEGGMVLTNDENLAERCREFRNLCFQKERRFVHQQLGWNYRMTNMQAALGLAQLESLERHIERKRQIGNLYQRELADMQGIQLPVPRTEYATNIYWVFGLVADSPDLAQQHSQKLAEQRIGTRPFFWPMHKQPVFEKLKLFAGESYPVAERLGACGFYVPSGLGVTDEEVRIVCDRLRQVDKEIEW